MKRAMTIVNKLLHPPKWILFVIPSVGFTALIFIFATGQTEGTPAYFIYGMSAYSLLILLVAAPKLVRHMKYKVAHSKPMQRIMHTKLGGKYLTDIAFRGNVSIYQGMTVNFLYMVFRIVTGIRYASVWLISMAVYYMILGGLRAYLIVNYKHRDTKSEIRCYRRTAWMLFILNIPMGGMIVLMVLANSGFSYPGYIIYMSAFYTFYAMIQSVINLVKFYKFGNPILSAAKILSLVSALMSVLGLQTAMISRFSENGENYRKMMNAITGGCVYGIVIVLAIIMLVHSRKLRKDVSF